MSRILPEYYFKSNDNMNEYYDRSKNYSQMMPNHRRSNLSRKHKGLYNIIEKTLDNHTVYYYIPVEYGRNYDISQLAEIPLDDNYTRNNTPILAKRRNIDSHDDNYIEKLPRISSRQRNHVPLRRPHMIERIYFETPSKVNEYVDDDYHHRPKNAEIYEHVTRERVPKQHVGL